MNEEYEHSLSSNMKTNSEKNNEKSWKLSFSESGEWGRRGDAGRNVALVLPFCTVRLFTSDEQLLRWKCNLNLNKHEYINKHTWGSNQRAVCLTLTTLVPQNNLSFRIEIQADVIRQHWVILRETPLIMATVSIVSCCQGDCSLIPQCAFCMRAPKRNAWMIFILRLLRQLLTN